jgi:uncharacterized protein YbdZ (MbtH family)
MRSNRTRHASVDIRVFLLSIVVLAVGSAGVSEAQSGPIVGRVVKDVNGDGQQQSGEPFIRMPGSACAGGEAIAGFSVRWSGPVTGSANLTQCPGGDPSYTSGTVPAGTYSMSLTIPAGWQITKSTQPTTTVPNGNDPWFYVRPPQQQPATGSIEGRVLKDINGDGQQQSGEPFIKVPGSLCGGGEAIAGFSVRWSGPVTGSANLTQCPGGDPSYTSGTVPAGTYSMSLTIPAGWQITKSTQPTTTVPNGNDPWFYVRPPQQQPVTGSIEGRVVKDMNGDGQQQSGEPFIKVPGSSCSTGEAIAGFSVSWSGPSNGSTTLNQCADNQPSYTSGIVPAGTYSMSLTIPAGWQITKSTQPTTTVPNGNDPWFYVQPPQQPEPPTPPPPATTGPIVGRVVNDLNGDGEHQTNEPFIRSPGGSCADGTQVAGFAVRWRGPVNGSIGLTLCAAGGPSYSSPLLPAGTYTMDLTAPNGWRITKSTQPTTIVPGGNDPWFYVHNDAPAPPAPPPQSADPSITMTGSHTQVLIGVDVTYTLTVRNGASTAATGVQVKSNTLDQLSFVASGSDARCSGAAVVVCQIGTLAANDTETLTIVMRAEEGPGRPLTRMTLTSSSADADASNNIAEANLKILPEQIASPDTNFIQGTLDPNLPTIVLTHGWSPADLRDEAMANAPTVLWSGMHVGHAGQLIVSALDRSGKSANVVSYIWPNAYTNTFGWTKNAQESDYKKAHKYVTTSGYDLGQQLLQKLGADYRHDIQFIGHSLGTGVNTWAAEYFLSNAPGVPRARFTALDRPDNLWGQKISEFFGADYFVTHLNQVNAGPSPNIDLTIENYYSTTGIAFGAPAAGSNFVPAYNHPALMHPSRLGQLVFDEGAIDHSGVQQWYRVTVDPTFGDRARCDGPRWEEKASQALNFLWYYNETLNPCQHGWERSLFGSYNGELPEPLDRSYVAPSGAPATSETTFRNQASATTMLSFSNFESIRGCAENTGAISCTSTSESIAMATIEIPTDSAYLSFAYRFTAASPADYAAVLIDGEPVWLLSGALGVNADFSVAHGIPIRGLSGTRTITVTYHGSGTGSTATYFELRDLHATGGVPLRRYLAEGATGSFFETQIALLNPHPQPTNVQLAYLKDDGTSASTTLLLPGHTRMTVDPAAMPEMASASFSTVIESGLPIIVDRRMTWGGTSYGSHGETAIDAPAQTWYLAEGSTSGDFSLFYLLQNPHSTPETATIRYLRPFGAPVIERIYPLAPNSRLTIPVDGEGADLANTDVSAVITATAPIVVERAMYKDRPSQPFAAGHSSAGVTAPATRWFLAEGATGPFFDLFILIANPSEIAARVRVDYLLLSGETYSKEYDVPANGRYTVWVDDEEIPAGSGVKPLANVAVSSTITSTNDVPVIVERTMWWPGPGVTPEFWTESHSTVGTTASSIRWGLADGEVGGARAAETYILIANTSAYAGQARVTLYFEDGTTAEKLFDLLPSSRTNVSVSAEFPLAVGRRFGSVIESVGDAPAQIVVERSIYTSTNGQTWNAGTSVLGVRF